MFKRTLVSLTLQYSVLLLLLFTVFSGAIYSYMDYTFGGNYQRSSDSQLHIVDSHEISAADVADTGLDRLRNGLLASYLTLLAAVPIISYALARRSLRPIQKSFEEQQRFVDDASHELRTPLSIVQGELELALSKKRSLNGYQAAIKTSLDEVQQLTDLTTQLLLMARGSHLEMRQSTKIIQLHTLVNTCVIRNQKLYSQRGIFIETKLTSCKVSGIPGLLSQAINNVLDNAAKFSADGGHILIRLSCTNKKALLTITDHGSGMTKIHAQKAFERFWRADSSRTVKGFGLGLPLVRQIIELHHGSVRLTSIVGKGTTATIELVRVP